MGAAASTDVEKEELRAAFGAYGGYGGRSDDDNDSTNRGGGVGGDGCGGSTETAMGSEEFELLLATHAPSVVGRLASATGGGGGNVSAAALALRDQFDSAKRKLSHGDGCGGGSPVEARSSDDVSSVAAARDYSGNDAAPANGAIGGGGAAVIAGAAAAAAEALSLQASRRLAAKHPDWASSKEANLQHGLVKGTLRSVVLRTVRFVVGEMPEAPVSTSSSSSSSSSFTPSSPISSSSTSPSSSDVGAGGGGGGSSGSRHTGLVVGARAVVFGLVSKPEANGCVVELTSFDAEKGRFQVAFLPDRKSGLLKPQNLKPAAATKTTTTATTTAASAAAAAVMSPTAAAAAKTSSPPISPPPSCGSSSNSNISSSSAGPSCVTLVALVDTGAERSAMSPTAAAKVGLAPFLLDPSFSRTVGGVGHAVGLGRVHFASISFPGAVLTAAAVAAVHPGHLHPASPTTTSTTTINNKNKNTAESSLLFDASFDVFQWPREAEFDAILGLDLLAKYSGVLDFKAGCMRLETEEALGTGAGGGGGAHDTPGVSLIEIPLDRGAAS